MRRFDPIAFEFVMLLFLVVLPLGWYAMRMLFALVN